MTETGVMPIQELLQLGRLATWARGKKPDAVVGRAGWPGRCPVACYLRSVGVVRPVVANLIGFDGFRHMETPPSIRRLVHSVDRARTGVPITAADLLAIIDDLEQQP